MTTTTRGFREPSYFVLASLLDGPRHGYGIIKQAALLSGGDVRLAPGTLYGALDRLAAAGLIESSGQEVVAGRPRHYYRLTDTGRESLVGEAQRLRTAAAAVLDLVAEQADEPTIDLVDHGPTIDLDAPSRPVERPLHNGYPVSPLHSVSATQPSSSPARVLDSVASHRL
ncbi:MAG: PadR family transcriptional regulator [Acidimicrobiia bacterium]